MRIAGNPVSRWMMAAGLARPQVSSVDEVSMPYAMQLDAERNILDVRYFGVVSVSIDDFRAFAARILNEPLFRQSRTAFVAPPVHYTNHLIEVLIDAHHYPFSRFTDRAAAMAWLLSDEPIRGMDG